MKKLYFLIITAAIVFYSCNTSHPTKADKVLWYDEPAAYFEETLVLGNGRLGASVFGDVHTDKIYLNDATLWSGQPIDANNNPDAHTFVEPIRKALAAENYKLADSLQRNIQGAFTQSYAPLGTMFIHFDHADTFHNYYRELDLDRAISTVKYEVDDTSFQREYFVSHPDQIMAIRLSSNKKESINCSIGFESLLKYKISTENGTMKVRGYAPVHAEPSYRGDMPNAIIFEDGKGTRFSTLFKISAEQGEITSTDSSLVLSNCNEAIIYVSIATSFNGFDKDPATDGLDDLQIAAKNLESAAQMDYFKLKQQHLDDYKSLFDRVELQLGSQEEINLPTNKRLLRYAGGEEDKNLEMLYFNYGRYLLISSSRTKNVPANLQGIWNPYIRPPWSSNYISTSMQKRITGSQRQATCPNCILLCWASSRMLPPPVQ